MEITQLGDVGEWDDYLVEIPDVVRLTWSRGAENKEFDLGTAPLALMGEDPA